MPTPPADARRANDDVEVAFRRLAEHRPHSPVIDQWFRMSEDGRPRINFQQLMSPPMVMWLANQLDFGNSNVSQRMLSDLETAIRTVQRTRSRARVRDDINNVVSPENDMTDVALRMLEGILRRQTIIEDEVTSPQILRLLHIAEVAPSNHVLLFTLNLAERQAPRDRGFYDVITETRLMLAAGYPDSTRRTWMATEALTSLCIATGTPMGGEDPHQIHPFHKTTIQISQAQRIIELLSKANFGVPREEARLTELARTAAISVAGRAPELLHHVAEIFVMGLQERCALSLAALGGIHLRARGTEGGSVPHRKILREIAHAIAETDETLAGPMPIELFDHTWDQAGLSLYSPLYDRMMAPDNTAADALDLLYWSRNAWEDAERGLQALGQITPKLIESGLPGVSDVGIEHHARAGDVNLAVKIAERADQHAVDAGREAPPLAQDARKALVEAARRVKRPSHLFTRITNVVGRSRYLVDAPEQQGPDGDIKPPVVESRTAGSRPPTVAPPRRVQRPPRRSTPLSLSADSDNRPSDPSHRGQTARSERDTDSGSYLLAFRRDDDDTLGIPESDSSIDNTRETGRPGVDPSPPEIDLS